MAKLNKIVPINRVSKFFSEEDYQLDIRMGREVHEGDGNFKAILYRVDNEMTTTIIFSANRGKNSFFWPRIP